jgi:REP element-mobilizing transposase RayT
MPRLHKHLPHLQEIWVQNPLFFITICTNGRARILVNEAVTSILISAWQKSSTIHRWRIGRYVVMPDHAHFFCAPDHEHKPLSQFIGDWKKWTACQIRSVSKSSLSPVWQPEYFDHLLRSDESYDQKWEYVRANPVRAGLADRPEDWRYSGEVEILPFR